LQLPLSHIALAITAGIVSRTITATEHIGVRATSNRIRAAAAGHATLILIFKSRFFLMAQIGIISIGIISFLVAQNDFFSLFCGTYITFLYCGA
jgi:hypothetical protein